jgi:hypothetical protein
VADGAALLASAIRAAVLAKAPRRTVQAVAAAVTGVIWRPTAESTLHLDVSGQAGTRDVEAPVGSSTEVRAARVAQRQRKKERRRSAKAMQCEAVRAKADGEALADSNGAAGLVMVPGGAHGLIIAAVGREGTFEDDGPAHGADADTVMVPASSNTPATAKRKAPSDGEAGVPGSAMLDDYWADSTKEAVKGATSAALIEGSSRRVYLLKLLERFECLLARLSAAAKPDLECKIQEVVRRLALTDLELAGLDEPLRV